MTESTDIAWEWLTVVELDREPCKFAFERTVNEGSHRVVAAFVACGSEHCRFGAFLEGSPEPEGDCFLLVALLGLGR
ncbi:hypothetical protein [Cryobacterium sp. TMT2-23]|uniref:hypothetical protein n=1 Tax=Cryobacterium sp. TMT2-23 TaxID=1259252 RepID=UPI00106C26A6|nr:hypothetical protein [Cryobacterium sp. TMT2-23]TFD24747.1 hypothetical protein E3T32_04635 [Cryobacterium sp. TMT2-23]